MAKAFTNLQHNHKQLQDQLEGLIDRHSLLDVLLAIGNICAEKSDHALTNWQDSDLADAWTRAMIEIDKAADHPKVHAVS